MWGKLYYRAPMVLIKVKSIFKRRPANHRVVGMMTGVVGIAGIKQIRRRRTRGNISHLGAGSSRWGERGSGGWVPTLREKTLTDSWIAEACFSLD